jgi:hypothetical protein
MDGRKRTLISELLKHVLERRGRIKSTRLVVASKFGPKLAIRADGIHGFFQSC